MKMKLNRVFCLLSLLVVVMFAGDAFAVFTFTPELPSSTYQNSAWYGESTYSDNTFHAIVQYAVYDTQDGLNEWGYEAPGDGRYIYAYQVFNANSDTQDIGYLKLFGAAGHTLTGNEVSGIGSRADTTNTQFPEQGIKPFSGAFDDTEKKISWRFLNAGSEFGVIGLSQHSYFLIYSSNSAPVMGSYEIKPPSGAEMPQAPEPATIVLFGTGGLILLRKLRKSV
jgi:hypothetical protein